MNKKKVDLCLCKVALYNYRHFGVPIEPLIVDKLCDILDEQMGIPKEIRVPMFISRASVEKYNRLLDMVDVDFKKEGIDEDSVIKTYTFRFADGIEADIKVCSGQTNLFVDPVLFENGHECCVLEPADTLDGEYSFEHNGTIYTAVLVGA